jgi:small subunit ribosomal protein S20
MPIIQSAKKKLRQDKNRTVNNDGYRHAYKDAIRDVRRKALHKTALTTEDLTKVYSNLDKATKKNIIHPNKAARLKSRMTKLQASIK